MLNSIIKSKLTMRRSPNLSLINIMDLLTVCRVLYTPVDNYVLKLRLPQYWRAEHLGGGRVRFSQTGRYRTRPVTAFESRFKQPQAKGAKRANPSEEPGAEANGDGGGAKRVRLSAEEKPPPISFIKIRAPAAAAAAPPAASPPPPPPVQAAPTPPAAQPTPASHSAAHPAPAPQPSILRRPLSPPRRRRDAPSATAQPTQPTQPTLPPVAAQLPASVPPSSTAASTPRSKSRPPGSRIVVLRVPPASLRAYLVGDAPAPAAAAGGPTSPSFFSFPSSDSESAPLAAPRRRRRPKPARRPFARCCRQAEDQARAPQGGGGAVARPVVQVGVRVAGAAAAGGGAAGEEGEWVQDQADPGEEELSGVY